MDLRPPASAFLVSAPETVEETSVVRVWPRPEHSRSAVDKAGAAIASPDAAPDERAAAALIVKNWRASHHFPLNSIQMHLRRAVRQVDRSGIVAQRVKRMPSIERKLGASETRKMRLTQMQDIGGCRAIVADPQAVGNVEARLLRGRMAHKVVGQFPYMSEPKITGYRSQHVVLQYQSRRFDEFSKHLIEVQIRTRLQHAWSTAVEAVDLFLALALKAGQGPADWHEFFRLAGDAFAASEGLPRALDLDPRIARERMRELRHGLGVDEKLATVGNALKVTRTYEAAKPARGDFYLLYLRAAQRHDQQPELRVIELPRDDPRRANLAYDEADVPGPQLHLNLEFRAPEAPMDVDVVLVSVDSLDSLAAAYPNYFADTALFFEALNSVC